jgi:hypothetical protein
VAKKPAATKNVSAKTTEREKFALWLDNDVLKRLRDYQDEIGVPVAVSIRRALDAYIETLPKPRR